MLVIVVEVGNYWKATIFWCYFASSQTLNRFSIFTVRLLEQRPKGRKESGNLRNPWVRGLQYREGHSHIRPNLRNMRKWSTLKCLENGVPTKKTLPQRDQLQTAWISPCKWRILAFPQLNRVKIPWIFRKVLSKIPAITCHPTVDGLVIRTLTS